MTTPLDSRARYLYLAESQRKLAVWARRKGFVIRAAKHEADAAFFLALAETAA